MKPLHSVLIVDDSPDDVAIATYYLNKSGVVTDVLSASDGSEALQLWIDYDESKSRYPDSFPPNVVLLDINMPRMNGFEFLSALRELDLPNEARVPVVIMLTSSEHGPDIEKARSYPEVAEYLTKPLTVDSVNLLAERFGASSG